MSRTFFLLLISLFYWGCQPDANTGMDSLDLMRYDIPVTILAPDSVEVKTLDLVVQKDVTVKSKNNNDYYVQIYAADATTNDVAQLKSEQMEEVKSNRYFSKIVEEQTDGFIYETKVDSNMINYGFRYVYLQGDKQYTFQTGLIGTFTAEEVKTMYDAVQQKK
ncbi:MAG: hypothetical protein AAGK47_07100 [Bacteroidota bacterium]